MLLIQSVSMLLGICATAVSTAEVPVPERYLSPRDYNPHPLLAATSPADLGLVLQRHPYRYFQRVDARQLDSTPVQFPEVPPTVRPIKSKTPGYITVPKNYAFAYAVRDKESGDDFSHKQAHNGHATKGEYRVKLPDGRTQIVSYTADSRGYKADVRYDGEAKPQTTGSLYYNQPSSQGYQHLSNSILQDVDYQDEQEVVYKQPIQVVYKQNSLAQQYYKADLQGAPRPLEVIFSSTPRPFKTLSSQLQYRALPQTAEEYTADSQSQGYYQGYSTPAPVPANVPGYFAPAAGPTEATPIEEDQDDIPAPAKPSAASRLYSSSTPAPTAVRFVFIPHQPSAHPQYIYSDDAGDSDS